MSEEEVAAEVEKRLALRPAAPCPATVVLYELPGSGESRIDSPQKWLALRKEMSLTMRDSLEKAGAFKRVDFLPEILLPAGGVADLATLRIAAARANADGVLVYTSEAGYEYDPNPFAILDPTIVGLLLAPGSRAASLVASKAVLVDVRTGYIYAVVEAYGDDRVGMVPYAYLDSEALEFEARRKAGTALCALVAEKAMSLAAGAE